MQCRKEDAEMPRQHNNNAGGFLTECKEAPCMYQGEGEKRRISREFFRF